MSRSNIGGTSTTFGLGGGSPSVDRYWPMVSLRSPDGAYPVMNDARSCQYLTRSLQAQRGAVGAVNKHGSDQPANNSSKYLDVETSTRNTGCRYIIQRGCLGTITSLRNPISRCLYANDVLMCTLGHCLGHRTARTDKVSEMICQCKVYENILNSHFDIAIALVLMHTYTP
jgi:hypothetical protein